LEVPGDWEFDLPSFYRADGRKARKDRTIRGFVRA